MAFVLPVFIDQKGPSFTVNADENEQYYGIGGQFAFLDSASVTFSFSPFRCGWILNCTATMVHSNRFLRILGFVLLIGIRHLASVI